MHLNTSIFMFLARIFFFFPFYFRFRSQSSFIVTNEQISKVSLHKREREKKNYFEKVIKVEENSWKCKTKTEDSFPSKRNQSVTLVFIWNSDSEWRKKYAPIIRKIFQMNMICFASSSVVQCTPSSANQFFPVSSSKVCVACSLSNIWWLCTQVTWLHHYQTHHNH